VTLNQLRTILYTVARILGDINAVVRGRIASVSAADWQGRSLAAYSLDSSGKPSARSGSKESILCGSNPRGEI
jgi:hypothetical protein